MMTLAQWSEAAGVAVQEHHSGARYVYEPSIPRDARWNLYHLSDWHVTTYSGGAVWLSAGPSLEPHRATEGR